MGEKDWRGVISQTAFGVVKKGGFPHESGVRVTGIQYLNEEGGEKKATKRGNGKTGDDSHRAKDSGAAALS